MQIIEGLELETELRECNEIQLRFGWIIELEGDKNIQIEGSLLYDKHHKWRTLLNRKLTIK